MRWGAWLIAACLFWTAGPLRSQQNRPPNAPSAASQNTKAPPAPAPRPAAASAPESLALPNLLQDVKPGESMAPTASSASGPIPVHRAAPAPRPPAPSKAPPPVVPAKGKGASTAGYTIRTRVNFVLVPVTVKNSQGELVAGLTYHDFQIFENGVRQHLTFFTEDPFPLSVAFVIDQSLPRSTMQKVNEALSGLQGAFAPYDEVAVYTYASHVTQATGFTGARSQRLTATLQRVQSPGEYMEVPINSGPMVSGPLLNGRMVDPNTTPLHNGAIVPIIPHETHDLNDAIFQAATDLAQRNPGRRRMIYVISDGKNSGSKISYDQVVRYLLSHKIAVYGTLVGESAMPILGFLDRYHLPFTMADNILPKYAAATGGALDAELSTNGIERSFAKIVEQVRNQYTLGYDSHISPLDSRFRKIEVRVLRPDLTVIAKQGYYPTATAMR